MARKPTDKCLLCKTRDATKTNSHIIPKFISSDFLGEKSEKKGYVLSSDTGSKKTIQDSPKENYILCPECESYFSLIEGSVAQELKNLHENSEGPVTEPAVVQSQNINPKAFHLFYYSQFWRASISKLEIFEPFKLTKELEEFLRNELNKFFASTNAQYEALLGSEALDQIKPYSVFTSLTFLDKTKNLIFAPRVASPFCLIADKFGLVLYDDLNSIPADIRWLSNTQNTDAKISLVPQQFWEDVMVNKPLELTADFRKKRLEEIEKLKGIADKLAKLSSKDAKDLRETLEKDLGID